MFQLPATIFGTLHGQICDSLSREVTEKPIHEFVITSRLDNSNAFLSNLPAVQIRNLQRVLHTATRTVTRTPKFQCVWSCTGFRHRWSGVKDLDFDLYKALHGMAPSYLYRCISTNQAVA